MDLTDASARQRLELERAREGAEQARKSGEGRLQALAAQQLMALDEAEGELQKSRQHHLAIEASLAQRSVGEQVRGAGPEPTRLET